MNANSNDMSLKFEDLVPQGDSFTLKKTGKTYHLRPFTLADEIWMADTFGESVEAIFKSMKMKEICRIVYRILEDEDKKEFKAKNVLLINEEGEEVEKRIGGYELLFLQIAGYSEKLEIFKSLLQTIGVSRGLQETLFEDNPKANEKQSSQKKSPPESVQITPDTTNSSTSSQANMDGQSSTSPPAPLGNSSGSPDPSRIEEIKRHDFKQPLQTKNSKEIQT